MCEKEPTKLVNPTINKEYAVDNSAPIPNKYTKIGTVNIDPPPPVRRGLSLLWAWVVILCIFLVPQIS